MFRARPPGTFTYIYLSRNKLSRSSSAFVLRTGILYFIKKICVGCIRSVKVKDSNATNLRSLLEGIRKLPSQQRKAIGHLLLLALEFQAFYSRI